MINIPIMQIERSLVASLLRRPEQFTELKKHIPEEFFTVPLYQKAMKGMHRCADLNAEIDTPNIATLSEMNGAEMVEFSSLLTDNSVGGYAPELFRELLNERIKVKSIDGMRIIATGIKSGSLDALEILDEMHALHSVMNSEILSHISKTKEDKVSDYRKRLNTGIASAKLIPTPFYTLNKMIEQGFRPGDYVLIGGRAGAGKSSLMLSLARHAAKCGKRAAYITGEMPISECYDRLAGIITGFGISEIRSGIKNDTSEMSDYFSFIEAAPIEIFECFENSIEELQREVESLLYKNYDIIFIDYLQKFAYSPKAKDEFQEIQKVSSVLRNYALRSNIALVVASSMNRSEAKSDKMSLHSFYGSSKLGHDGTIGLILDAEDTEDAKRLEMMNGKRPVTLTVAKNRNGACGDISLTFELRSQKMWDTADPRIAPVKYFNETEKQEEDIPF